MTPSQGKGTWVPYALGITACFSVTNFLLGAISELTHGDVQASLSAPIVLWIGMGVVGLVTSLRWLASGRGFAGLPAPVLGRLSAIAGITLAGGMLALKLGVAADPDGRGPIVAISSANSVIVALLAWRIMRERLTVRQVCGMAVVVAGLVALALGAGSRASLRGVAFGLVAMGLFGVTNTLVKWIGTRGADSITATVVLWLGGGAVGVGGLVLTMASGRGLAGLTSFGPIALAFLAGLALAAGMYCIKRAVTLGPAGPATAIGGANALVVTALDWLIFGRIPSPLKIIGMALALTGIALLALGGHRRGTSGR